MWSDRDRFVLSAGHGSTLLYSLLHLYGYDISMDDLKHFRQWESKTPGHPENFMTPGVEITTWPLGQGLSSAVGMAIAESHLAATYNEIDHTVVDHYTYVLCSDGDHMEWVTGEAASLAGHLGLGKLIALYDSNDISIDGGTHLSFTESVAQRYEAYDWHVQIVEEGDTDLDAIEAAIHAAQAEIEKPSMIIIKTTIGYGSPNKAWTSDAHGSPLGEEEMIATKKQLQREAPEQHFYIPEDVQAYFTDKKQNLVSYETTWNDAFTIYSKVYPAKAKEYTRRMSGELPAEVFTALQWCTDGEAATRKLSGICLNTIASVCPELMWGSADLTPSNKTYLTSSHDYQQATPDGRNIRFGVREHGMWAIANGLALHGGILPYVATFLIFTDYMKPAMRLAALSQLQVIYVMTHDSIALGEDGPTHQPVEILAWLRAIPNMYVLRPADATETAAAYHIALSKKMSPSTLSLTRQGVPALDETHVEKALKGGYIVVDVDDADTIIIASGSELSLSVQAAHQLNKQWAKVRVVSMLCQKLFEEQEPSYKASVLPRNITKRVVVEAWCRQWWERYVWMDGIYITVDTFWASAPGGEIMKNYGFSVENIVKRIEEL